MVSLLHGVGSAAGAEIVGPSVGDCAEFDGVSAELYRNSSLSGLTATKTLSLVCAVKSDIASGTHTVLEFDRSGGGNFGFILRIFSGLWEIRGWNSSGSIILNSGSLSAATTGWARIALSFDLANVSKRNFYIDDVNQSPSWSTYTNDNLDLNISEIKVGGDSPWDGKIGFLWLSSEYIDFSVTANRRLFFDASNNLVDVGSNGSIPTGNPPALFLDEDFHLGLDRSGNGNDFSITGAVTDGGAVGS